MQPAQDDADDASAGSAARQKVEDAAFFARHGVGDEAGVRAARQGRADAAATKERSMRFLRNKGLLADARGAPGAQRAPTAGQAPPPAEPTLTVDPPATSMSTTASHTAASPADLAAQYPAVYEQQASLVSAPSPQTSTSESRKEALRAKIRERQARIANNAPPGGPTAGAVPMPGVPNLDPMPTPNAQGVQQMVEPAGPIDKSSEAYQALVATVKQRLFLELVDADIKQLEHNQLVSGDSGGPNSYVVKTKDGVTDVRLSLSDEALQGLHPDDIAALRALDLDRNNELSTSELLAGAQEQEDLTETAWILGAMIVAVLVSSFFLFSLTYSMTNPLAIKNTFLTNKNGNEILRTSEAEQNIGVALLPLFNLQQMHEVKELAVANLYTLGGANTTVQKCATCPSHFVVQVETRYKYSDTFAAFYGPLGDDGSPGTKVTVTKGEIQVSRVPGQDPNVVFSACALATCSQVKVKGMNVAALKAKARALGYVNTGRRAISIAALARWRSELRRQARRKGLDDDKVAENEFLGIKCTRVKKKKGESDTKLSGKYCRVKTKDCQD